MKEFKDLEHNKHSIGCGTQAVLDFDNGYGVSVLFGTTFYSNGIDTYEVAIKNKSGITFETDITSDVIGYVSAEEVTDIMKQVQELKDDNNI